MADEPKTEPAKEPVKEPSKEPAPSQNEWEKITGGKYKSTEEVAKALKEAETKMGEMSSEVGKAREFAQTVQPLLETLRNDPELFKQVDEALRKRNVPHVDADKRPDVVNKEVRDVTSDLIIQRFEERYGIDKMDAEKRRELRNKIGTQVTDLTGQPLDSVDLRRLPQVLESAYILANKDKLVDKAKLEAQIEAKQNADGTIGSLSSQPGKSQASLTAEEERVAKKMGLTSEEYIASKKKSSR